MDIFKKIAFLLKFLLFKHEYRFICFRWFRHHRLRFRVKSRLPCALDDDNEDRRESGVCTDYEWRQCAVTSMREACVRLVTHRLPAPGVCSLPSNLHRTSEHGAAGVLSQQGSRITKQRSKSRYAIGTGKVSLL